jgi:HSP90 family molecular chaperone
VGLEQSTTIGGWTGSSYYREQHYQRFFSSSVDSTTTTTTTGTMNEESNDTDNSNNNYEFKAETRQLLDIVTHSLYTDREVFLRELVSNASDACEKLRHLQAANMLSRSSSDNGVDENDKEIPLEIRITTNDMDQTLTISDTGIGFTKDDMIRNLGTIAASGSKAFVQALQARPPEDRAGVTAASQGIIGKFGVGFYSSFMVGDVVHVRSR